MRFLWLFQLDSGRDEFMLHNRSDRSLARGKAMELDTDRIDAAVLALLLLGLYDGCRVWKTFDWDAMNRLHEKGFISDPVSRAKSVVLTEDGQREAQRLFQTMFAKR